MKNTILSLFVMLATAFSAVAQSGAATTIRGTATNADREFMLLRYRDQLDTLWVDSGGNFLRTINLQRAEECRIINGKQIVKLYVLPGDELTVDFDTKVMKDPGEFAGKSALYCAYYKAAAATDAKLARTIAPKVLAMKDPQRVIEIMDSVQQVRIADLDTYVYANNLNADFRNYMVEALVYQSMAEMATYRATAANYSNEAFAEGRAAMDKKLASVALDNVNVLYSENYQSFVRTFIGGTVSETMALDSPDDLPAFYLAQMDESVRLLATQEVLDYILKEIMMEAMREAGTQDISAVMQRLEQHNTNEPMKARVRKVWAQYAAIQPGSVCPETECYDANGNTMMISDLKGKAVYIDVWATWCGPCKKEIPYLKTLEEHYHGRNIEFVSISTDQDVQKWKDFLVLNPMSGTQVHQSDDFEKSISKHFMVNSIPRFILLDAEGKIVNANAPRPSSGETLHALIDSVLNY